MAGVTNDDVPERHHLDARNRRAAEKLLREEAYREMINALDLARLADPDAFVRPGVGFAGDR